jgi:hypothetical protein
MAGILSVNDEAPKKVIIKFVVEADGVPVYTEHLDADDIANEMTTQAEAVTQGWIGRIKCVICCRKKAGFVACLARCLVDGKCCDGGHRNCQDS